MQPQPATGNPNGTTERQIANIQNTLRALEMDAHQAGLGYDFLLKVTKKQFIIGALERNKWNQCRAARDLQVHRNTLNRTMSELNIVDPSKPKPAAYRQRVLVRQGERFPTI